jgi:hypothetical protein
LTPLCASIFFVFKTSVSALFKCSFAVFFWHMLYFGFLTVYLQGLNMGQKLIKKTQPLWQQGFALSHVLNLFCKSARARIADFSSVLLLFCFH